MMPVSPIRRLLLSSALIAVRDVTVRFGGIVALDRVSFTIPAGCLLGLIGPNGAGKTTLLKMILGELQPDSGTVNGDKFRWTAVFQENCLLEGLDAEGNLRFVLGANYNAAAAQAHLEELSCNF